RAHGHDAYRQLCDVARRIRQRLVLLASPVDLFRFRKDRPGSGRGLRAAEEPDCRRDRALAVSESGIRYLGPIVQPRLGSRRAHRVIHPTRSSTLMSARLRDLIDDGRVHVADGAMGTMLYSHGMFVNVCYDELNLKQPNVVRDVHAGYVRAGAEILETNTFGANPVKLSGYGLFEQTETINRRAVEIARSAAGARASVVGTIGPLGVRIEPFGPTSRVEAEEFFRRQVAGLLEGGVDGFILETFSDLDEIKAAFRA